MEYSELEIEESFVAFEDTINNYRKEQKRIFRKMVKIYDVTPIVRTTLGLV